MTNEVIPVEMPVSKWIQLATILTVISQQSPSPYLAEYMTDFFVSAIHKALNEKVL